MCRLPLQVGFTVITGLPSNDAAASTYARLSSALSAYVNGSRLPADLLATLPNDFPSDVTVLSKTVTIGPQSLASAPPPVPVSPLRHAAQIKAARPRRAAQLTRAVCCASQSDIRDSVIP